MALQIISRVAQLALIATCGIAVGADLPKVVILATGGTIAGEAASGTQEGYQSGKVSVDALIKAVPGMEKLAAMEGEQVASIGSQDMNDEVWLKLAQRVNAAVKRADVAGVVITHGTDTMEETSYFLNLVVKSRKPVVLTGSMRPSTAISADGPLNLYNAVAVAVDPSAAGRGVLVVANDQIHSAHEIMKSNTTSVETFMSPFRGIIGTSHYGNNHYYRGPYQKHTFESEFSTDGVDKLPRVDILMAHASMSPDLIEAAVAKGAKGLVIAGVGNGNMTSPALEALRIAASKGVIVVRASRVPTGYVGRNVEVDDDKLGFIASGELSPPRARVLLKLALLKTDNPKKIQEYFNSY